MLPHNFNFEVFDHAADQRRALGNLLKTGDYSDLVIVCGQARHKVHKAVICPRSDFFKAACGSGFKEAQTGEIELPDDDPFAVSMMIEYLYHQKCTIPWDAKLVPEDQRSPAVTSPPATAPSKKTRHSFSGDSFTIHPRLHPLQGTFFSASLSEEPGSHKSLVLYQNLHVHYKLYALGQKYGIEGLQDLAIHNFEAEVYMEFQSSSVDHFGDLIYVMNEIYTCAAEAGRPLCDAIVRILKSKPKLFEREDMKEFLKEEGLAYDMVMSYVQDTLIRGEGRRFKNYIINP
ncbi:hypothetical protein FPRO06_13577 [Fusarium proliferatum]|nr:hypothetical protein FPRO06_13577 [Fusarium proliferatum]